MADRPPTTPIDAERRRVVKQSAAPTRWQSSARWTLVAVVGVVVIGGLGFYWLFLRGDASPPAPARPVVASTTIATSSTNVTSTTVTSSTVAGSIP
jgi:polyferredoxin